MEKFSVLMSVYYKEKPEYLEQSIISVLNQTIKTDDFVIVCDGPLGSELEAVLNKYKEEINIVRLPENKGLANALNEGLNKCKYSLVARVDSDDINFINRFEKQLEVFKNDSTIEVLSATVLEFDEDVTNIVGKRALPLTHEEITSYSRRRCPINHPVTMLRKSAIEKVGGYSSKFFLFEDYYIWVCMLMAGVRFANMNEPLLYMRVNKNMYMRRGGKKYAQAMLSFRWWMLKNGWCSLWEFMIVGCAQAVVCRLPNTLRKFVYSILHR